MAPAVFFTLESKGILAYLKSFMTNLILGEAYPILLIKVICLIMSGASISLTPKPQITKNGSQGIAVAAYS